MSIFFQVYFNDGYYHLLEKGDYMYWFCCLLAFNLISHT